MIIFDIIVYFSILLCSFPENLHSTHTRQITSCEILTIYDCWSFGGNLCLNACTGISNLSQSSNSWERSWLHQRMNRIFRSPLQWWDILCLGDRLHLQTRSVFVTILRKSVPTCRWFADGASGKYLFYVQFCQLFFILGFALFLKLFCFLKFIYR